MLRVIQNLSHALRLRHVAGMLVLLTISLAVPLPASAQITTATLVGTITDSGGAAIPNASVTAEHRNRAKADRYDRRRRHLSH